MLNQTIIVGRLVKDPELKVTDTGKKVTKIIFNLILSIADGGIYEELEFVYRNWTCSFRIACDYFSHILV